MVRPILLAVMVAGRVAVAAPIVEGTCPQQTRSGVSESICVDEFRIGHDIVFAGEPISVCMTGGDEVCRKAARVETGADGTRTAFDRHDHKLVSYRMKGALLDGPFVAWDADGHEVIDGVFRDGVREGTWNEWKDGRHAITAIFVGGLFDGIVTAQLDRIELRIAFKHGVRDGRYAPVDLHGYVSTVQPLPLDAIIEGTETRLDGVSTGTIINGNREGVWETRAASGVLVGVDTYRHGEPDGISWRMIDGQKQILPWRAGTVDGWGQIIVDGAISRRLWENGRLVEVSPRPPDYAWRGIGADLTAGPMFGATTSIQTHLDIAHVRGTAHTSRDGERVAGRYVTVGGELVIDAPVGATMASGTVGMGPSFELGYAFGARDSEDRNRPARAFVRAVPSLTNDYDVRARIGVGIDSPAWTMRAGRAAARASDGMLPHHCTKHDDDDGCAGFISMWFIPVIWLTAPVWTINHVELTAEIGSDYHARFGVLLGWGL